MSKTKTPALVAVPLTMNVAEDTLRSALTSGAINGPHGYAYWCSDVRAVGKGGRLLDRDPFRWLMSGGALRVTEQGENDKERYHTMALDGFLKGFAQWVVEWGRAGTLDGPTGAYDFDIDAPASDAILQFAVFGEQKYG